MQTIKNYTVHREICKGFLITSICPHPRAYHEKGYHYWWVDYPESVSNVRMNIRRHLYYQFIQQPIILTAPV